MISPIPTPPLRMEGLRVLIPRGGDLGEALRGKVTERGGIATVVPFIETVGASDPAALDAAVARWNDGKYDWIVVTSATTATVLQNAGARPQPKSKTAAVGPVTAAAMQRLGFRVHVIPGRDFSADGLAISLVAALPAAGINGDGVSARVLLPVSEIADTRLEQALRKAGHEVDRVGAYTTVATHTAPIATVPEAIGAVSDDSGTAGSAPTGLDATEPCDVVASDFDVVLVTSGSAARAIAARFAHDPAAQTKAQTQTQTPAQTPGATPRFAAIGRPTAQALTGAGLRADIVAELSTTDGLLDAVSATFFPESPAAAAWTRATQTPHPFPSDGDQS